MKPRQARRGRLTRSAEFERVYRQGRSCGSRHLVLHVFPSGQQSEPRVGLSVSRRVGGAVQRNRVKRMLREAVEALRPRLTAGQDVVIVARPDIVELIEADGLDGVQRALAALVDQEQSRQRSADGARARRRAA